MNAEQIRNTESRYLTGMTAQFEAAKGTLLRGTHWKAADLDAADKLRSLMAKHNRFDRRLLAEAPRNRRLILHGYERAWWFFGKKRTGIAIASSLAPQEWHVLNNELEESAPRIDTTALREHIQSLIQHPKLPHVIGVCMPTGFEGDAALVLEEFPNATIVLTKPAPGGGWQVVGHSRDADPRIVELFDPEDDDEKVARVTRYLHEHSSQVLTGGMSVEHVAETMSLPEDVVQRGFEAMANEDPELHVGSHDGDTLLYRGVANDAQESMSMSMSMVDKIRQLFSKEGNEAQKINELSKRRASLSQRRDRLYDDIAKLENREADLMAQGRQNKSQVSRKRIAAQVAQLRKDIQRQNATANMLNKQINVISTDVHNLTLIQQGQMAQLPSTESLTENAVKAEEMLETLNADAELVNALESSISDTLTSDEELAIMDEFDVDDAVAKNATRIDTDDKSTTAERTPPASDPGQRQASEPEAT